MNALLLQKNVRTNAQAHAGQALRQDPAPPPPALAAQLAFLLLYPGFFAYHTVLGLGLIRAWLGGFYTPVALLFLPPLLQLYRRHLRRARYHVQRVDVVFFAYLAYFALVIACNLAAGRSSKIATDHLFEIVYLIELFIIFKLTDFDQIRFQVVIWACLLAMSATVFYFAVDGTFYLAALGTSKDPDSVATYQGFSRSYLLTAVALLGCPQPAWRRWLVYAIGVPTLFINSARSEFGALVFVIPVLELYHARHKLAALGAALLAAVAIGANRAALLALVPSNRTLELLDLSQSSSATMRHQLSLQAWRTIEQQPLLGSYASYEGGHYAHNVLSAWVDLGLFGFVFLLGMLIVPALHLLVDGFVLRRPSRYLARPWALLCMTLLLLALSHYFTDMLVGAALGAYARYGAERQHG
jgi:hypothetical protein